jgi:DNA modification methylase
VRVRAAEPQQKHRGYPTEKHLEMLRTIVATSSSEDSIVLDCFSGSGTTLVAADQLNRSWIGIDSSEVAIKIALGRLKGRIEPAQASLFAPANDDILYRAA